jgi:hypothetical protein
MHWLLKYVKMLLMVLNYILFYKIIIFFFYFYIDKIMINDLKFDNLF